MKAIQVLSESGRPRLVWAEAPDPMPGRGEVLVQVGAAGVNRADLMQARGQYPVPAGESPILGLELAGTVTTVPAEVEDVRVGQRVCALVGGGGYAEQATIDVRMLMELPDHWSFSMGAAIPEAWLTAFVNLFEEGGLCQGERLLIHAGGSGVGTAAVQLAHAAGARVIVTAGTDEKCRVCSSLGADRVINYRHQDFEAVVADETNGLGVDLVLDPVGATYLQRNLAALGRRGRLVQIGLLSGSHVQLDMAPILRKNLSIRGSTLRPRPLEEKVRITRAFKSRFWKSLIDGELVPVVDRTFEMKNAELAHEYVADNRNIGKVVLTL